MSGSGWCRTIPFSRRRLICIPKHKHIFKPFEGVREQEKKCYFNRLLKYLLKLIYMQIKLKTPEGEEICTIFSVLHTYIIFFSSVLCLFAHSFYCTPINTYPSTQSHSYNPCFPRLRCGTHATIPILSLFTSVVIANSVYAEVLEIATVIPVKHCCNIHLHIYLDTI